MAENISFSRSLIKGRIAETVFAQMFRDSKKYTVLDFGYEKLVPQLVGQEFGRNNPVVENLRVAPDFAVINKATKEVRLIEVKYRSRYSSTNILNIALRMHTAWNPSFLFLATPEGFFFDEVGTIISHRGSISPLEDISPGLQKEYLDILNDFEKDTRPAQA